MRLIYLFFTATIVSLSMCVAAGDTEYSSLEEFCVATKADTKENCACGQETANKIMTDEEQATTLAMMRGDPNAAASLADRHDLFMDKIAQITKGCVKQ